MLYRHSPAPAQVRLRCRNPRCAGYLKVPTENPRDAFCCRGCEGQYFATRCLVCEQLFSRKTSRRVVCSRAKCRYDFKRHPERFSATRYPSAKSAHNGHGSPTKPGIKNDAKPDRGFRRIAGPEAEAINFQNWPVPVAKPTLIKRDTPPVNIIGGYKFPGAPKIRLSPPAPSGAPAGPIIGDDLATFLRRSRP
jgi:hypothetical protein